jgi:serine/threonine protein kinase
MLSALDYLAAVNIVHRDVEPKNILMDYQKGRDDHVLADFGLCNNASVAHTRYRTTDFIAPEIMLSHMFDEKQTPKADIWSLWRTLFWCQDLSLRHLPCNYYKPQRRHANVREPSG